MKASLHYTVVTGINMEKRTLFIIGAILVLGAVFAAAAVAQNEDKEKTKLKAHECTPEMMTNMDSDKMAENCTPDMMESEECEDMADAGMEGCSTMMETAEDSDHTSDHCGSMGSNMEDMMGAGKGSMM